MPSLGNKFVQKFKFRAGKGCFNFVPSLLSSIFKFEGRKENGSHDELVRKSLSSILNFEGRKENKTRAKVISSSAYFKFTAQKKKNAVYSLAAKSSPLLCSNANANIVLRPEATCLANKVLVSSDHFVFSNSSGTHDTSLISTTTTPRTLKTTDPGTTATPTSRGRVLTTRKNAFKSDKLFFT